MIVDTKTTEALVEEISQEARAIESTIALSDDTALRIVDKVIKKDRELGREVEQIYNLLIHVKDIATGIIQRTGVIL